MSFKIWWGPVPTSLYLPVALAIKRYSFFSVYLPLLKMTLLSTLAIRYVTLGFLAKISFTPLLYHPGGCLGCPEKETRSRNYNLFGRSAVFQPKWNDIQNTYKNHQNPVKSYCFLGYFQSLFNFSWKTAAQTN